MSDEITAAHACALPESHATARKISAGTASPAMAATVGMTALRHVVSSPVDSSRRTSSPTAKKNTVMSALLMRSRTVKDADAPPIPTSMGVCQTAS